MYGSCRIIRSSVILTALFKWSFGVIFREFKTVTGSIVTFVVEVELGVNSRQICERYYTVISIKITAAPLSGILCVPNNEAARTPGCHVCAMAHGREGRARYM